MSVHNRTVLSCPRPQTFHDEVEEVLFELARLELELEREVERLLTLTAPKSGKLGMPRFRGRELWWWRAKLVEWAYSLRTEHAHPTEVVAGLKLVLRDFSDRDLISFLDKAVGGFNAPTAA